MIRDVAGGEDIVVVDRPLRFDGPIVDLESVSPLGFAIGPVVPLDAPGTRDVLSPRRVRDISPTSVAEVAGHLPGVTSRLYSGDEYMRPSISSRGMPDNGFTEHVSVLVDGFNMSTLAYGWTAISIFPFTAERIWAAALPRRVRGALRPEQHGRRRQLRHGPDPDRADVPREGRVRLLRLPLDVHRGRRRRPQRRRAPGACSPSSRRAATPSATTTGST